MPELYPLRMLPHFDRRPWGARDLAPLYDRHAGPGEEPIGEAWLTADISVVANGSLAGLSLGELCRRYGRQLVGEAAPEADRFPLLIKFLFPRDKLSVQVHPDDPTARGHGEPCGKTECWYVVAAEPGARIGLGLRDGVSRAQLESAIAANTAENLLNWIELHAGEMIYVDAGTVHTLGPGSIILETQQNSDTTYRLYDYGRPRPLHLADGLAAVKPHTAAGKVAPRAAGDGTLLISVPCFEVTRHRLEGEAAYSPAAGAAGVQVLVATAGAAVVESPGAAPAALARGDALVVPAAVPAYRVRPQGSVEFLRITLPLRAGLSPAERSDAARGR
jgi:mannose-6-phosphate isomerase